MTRKMFLMVLAAGAAFLPDREAAADAPPYVSGYYAPTSLVTTCKHPSFEVFDWVLSFDSKGMGDSEGICTFKNWKSLGGNSYRIQMRCNSQGELSNQTITIKTNGKGGKITTIDGDTYAFCGPLTRK